MVADFCVHPFKTSSFLGFVTNRLDRNKLEKKNPHSRKLKTSTNFDWVFALLIMYRMLSGRGVGGVGMGGGQCYRNTSV